MAYVIVWLALAVVAGVIAGNKGRSRPGFFLLAVLLSPLVGILAALIASPNAQALERDALASGQSKKCPSCAELIRSDAAVCRYCGREVFATASTGTSSQPQTPIRSRGSYRWGYRIGRFFSGRR